MRFRIVKYFCFHIVVHLKLQPHNLLIIGKGLKSSVLECCTVGTRFTNDEKILRPRKMRFRIFKIYFSVIW